MATDTTPTTPAECRAEQERWQKPLEKYETLLAEYEREDEAYWLQDDVLSKPYPRRLEAKRRRLERLREELNDSLTPTLAAAHIALLAAHAEALEREARIMAHFQAAHDALQRRADEGRMDFEIAARVVEARLEAAKLNLPPPPAQAPASAGGE